MENAVAVKRNVVVFRILVATGDCVEPGDLLLEFEEKRQ